MKKNFFFVIALFLVITLAACSDLKEKGNKSFSDLMDEVSDTLEEETNSHNEEETPAREAESGEEKSEEDESNQESQRWPDGYDKIPEFEVGRAIYFSDYGNYFSIIYEEVSRNELDQYLELLEADGFNLDYENSDGSISYTKRNDAEKLFCNVAIRYDADAESVAFTGTGKK